MNNKYIADYLQCRTVDLTDTGDPESDNKSNLELYLDLVTEGINNQFVPVVMYRKEPFSIDLIKYEYPDNDEGYHSYVRDTMENVSGRCHEVWYGRLLYDYYLDLCDNPSTMAEYLDTLKPPADEEYQQFFSSPVERHGLNLNRLNDITLLNRTISDYAIYCIPVEEPWQAIVYIPMGGFNWCPAHLHQVAIAKYLYDRFGAQLMYMDEVSLDYYLPEPIDKQADVEEAAKYLMTIDSDVYEDYETAVHMIRGSQQWQLWWD